MRRVLSRFSMSGDSFCVPFAVFAPITFFCLLICSSVALSNTWEPIGPEGGSFIFSMTNPANPDEITAITTSPSPSNVYRSTDAGASWTKIGEIPTSYVSDVSAFDFSTIYALASSRCYRSTDGGVSWTSASLPSSVGWPRYVCVDPTDSRRVYAAGYEWDHSNRTDHMAFFRSTDGGLSWSGSQFFSFESFYPYDMAISKTNPLVMYVSGNKRVNSTSYGALFKTSDGGNTWTDISSSVNSERYNYFYSVAVDPTDNDKVYIGGGRYFYTSSRAGRNQQLTWTRRSFSHYINTIAIDPVDPSRIYAGSYESMAFSTNSGLSWTLRDNCIKSGPRHIDISPADPSKIYVSTRAGFYRSPDSGSTWNTAHNGILAASINAMAVDPSGTIAQTSGYLMAYGRSHGRGRTNTWEDIVTPESCGEVCDILINPDNPDTVLVLEGYG